MSYRAEKAESVWTTSPLAKKQMLFKRTRHARR